ncbi:MAG: transposase [Patescibacteria group bacterium]
MARPLRVEYPGALYHVVSRGNEQKNIFKDNVDRLKFLDWVKDAIEIHNLICHAYCLMNNHYHILIETPDANLSKAMRDINGNYTQWFNSRHRRAGHLLQGRYKSFIIEKETYLLEVARYIVLNPVRAKFVKHPNEWKWSSYKSTAGHNKIPDWLHTDWTLGFFGKNRKKAQNNYRQFVKDGMNADDPHNEAKNGFLLGSPQFIHWIWETKTRGSEKLIEHTREQRIVGRPTLNELFDGIQTLKERDGAIKMARMRCGYTAVEISRHVSLHPSVIGRISKGKYNTKSQ